MTLNPRKSPVLFCDTVFLGIILFASVLPIWTAANDIKDGNMTKPNNLWVAIYHMHKFGSEDVYEFMGEVVVMEHLMEMYEKNGKTGFIVLAVALVISRGIHLLVWRDAEMKPLEMKQKPY